MISGFLDLGLTLDGIARMCKTLGRQAVYLLELAWSCHDYADALLKRPSTGSGRAGVGDQAMSLLEESVGIC